MIAAILNGWLSPAAIEQGLIYGLLALGVFLTFRILNFADLTVDSSFTTGAGACAILITNEVNPWLATFVGLLAGAGAGAITGLLHTKLKIDPLLSSILTMIGLWTINLWIMGKSNLPFGRSGNTIFSPARDAGLINSYWLVLILVVFVAVFVFLVNWFLTTDFGLAVQATGDNPLMATSMGVATDTTKLVTLMVSNGLVGLSGAVFAQSTGGADISMGVGMILVGLASVIVGNAIVGTRYMLLAVAGAVVGSVLYRLVILWAMKIPFFDTNAMKLISAVVVTIALVASRISRQRSAARKTRNHSEDDRPEPILDVPAKLEA